MSLTATLLHNDPVALRQLVSTLPKGRKRTHHIDARPPRNPKPSGIQWPKKTTSPKKLERIHSAIAAGARFVRDIHIATGYSKTVIWRAIHQLEDCPTGPRILRDPTQKPSQFTALHA